MRFDSRTSLNGCSLIDSQEFLYTVSFISLIAEPGIGYCSLTLASQGHTIC